MRAEPEQEGKEATAAAAARRVDGEGEAGRREAEEARRSAMAMARRGRGLEYLERRIDGWSTAWATENNWELAEIGRAHV